jgi:hypothetical protein
VAVEFRPGEGARAAVEVVDAGFDWGVDAVTAGPAVVASSESVGSGVGVRVGVALAVGDLRLRVSGINAL